MPGPRVLITGFEPYGGRDVNPAHEVMSQLDGRHVDACDVVGRSLPVRLDGLDSCIAALLEDVKPDIVLSLGLWPGESVIRIERVALNLADFDIADNAGARLMDQPLVANGGTALMSTLPVRKIETALLDAGIPAQVSNTAGTFLCNACLYGFLSAVAHQHEPVRCGFLHLPYLPQQVARLLARRRQDPSLELHQQKQLASMSLDMMVCAVELAIGASRGEPPPLEEKPSRMQDHGRGV
ncbi:MAG: pyroglutamyl-peptidase I [Anderseniella sp.]|nr:pyroglutamyl-peptidase I [Anderseniella sp.]